MTISPELMKAILAMHSYNRGYNEGIEGIGDAIGTATYLDQSNVAENSPERDASFYAVAYNYNGEKVISYRGTDTEPVGMDALTGWGVGAGSATGEQAVLAQEFYNTVSGGDLFGANSISFTGHSMGGGSPV